MALLDWFRRPHAVKMSSLELFREIYGGLQSATGKSINWKTALDVTTVLACARKIAEGIALPPLKLLRESEDGRTKVAAKELPLYALLTRRPNFYQTAFEYLQTIGLHLALCGEHFSFKNRAPGSGRILSLLPFEPQYVTVKRDTKTLELRYEVRPIEGEPMTFPAEDIWHIKGPSWNGYLGLETVKLAREAIGLAMATEESHARMHKLGAKVGGLISVEGTLNETQHEQMRAWVEKNFEGSANAGRTMILDRAAKFTSSQQTGVDAEHLDTRRYQVEEVCRAMGVLPIIVGYSDKAATYASAEQMFLAHERLTLAPYWKMIEQSIDANLLSDRDRSSGVYSAFTDEGIRRGSMKDKKDTVLALVNGGLMTPNEGRAVYDLNPDADPASDKLRIPANITGSVPEPDKTEPDAAAKAMADLSLEVRALIAKPAPPIHVDARTSISDGAVRVKVEQTPVQVDARTTIADGAVKLHAPVDVKTGETHNHVELPGEADSVTEHDRDPQTKEILRSRKKVKRV
jgi:HK97 family phage portal protein